MLLTIIVFILILGLLILVHELGHFLSARIFKVKAEEFGFGYPPRIFGWVKDKTDKWKLVGKNEKAEDHKRTVWSLNWLPLGGFVKIKGEDGEDKNISDSFGSRPVWQRFIMLFAGVFMNFVLCAVLLSIGFMVGIPSAVDGMDNSSATLSQAKVQIIELAPDSPAVQSGLRAGDVILSINNENTPHIEDVQNKVNQFQDQAVSLTVQRGEEQIEFNLTPQFDEELGRAVIGVQLVETALISYPWYRAIYMGFVTTIGLVGTILTAFGQLIGSLFGGPKLAAEVAGPVGIAVLTGQVVDLGWVYVLQFTALLSLNLGIINLLPIPALDGGRILFLAIEKIKGRPVKQELEAAVHQIGFILLMGIIILVTYKDIRTYGEKIWQAVSSIF